MQSKLLPGVVVAQPKESPKPIFGSIYAGLPATLHPAGPQLQKVKGSATPSASGVFGGANLPGMKGR
jgi:hypothetical protein